MRYIGIPLPPLAGPDKGNKLLEKKKQRIYELDCKLFRYRKETAAGCY